MPAASSSLTLKTVISQIRTDLGDLDSSNYRWTDAVLTRQIDRAVDRYSKAAPSYGVSQIATITQSRLYPSPYDSWWVEQVEYPLGYYPKRYRTYGERISPLIAAPALGTMAAAASAGAGTIPAGTYKYAVTFTVPGGGETTPSPALQIVTVASGAIQLTAIPTGPYGVTSRKLYRTAAGGNNLLLLAAIADNTTATYTDLILDGALGAAAPSANSTEGLPQLEIDLSGSELPADATGLIEVTAGYKHELDQAGSTIPEKHWDAITLGAEANTILQYLSAVNDNFDYVDGQFRDRVDDTKAPAAWMAQYRAVNERWHQRLQEIRNEVQATRRIVPQWGDKPAQWNRI